VGPQCLELRGLVGSASWLFSSTIPPRFATTSAINMSCSSGGAIKIKSASTSAPGQPARFGGGSPASRECHNACSQTYDLLWLRRNFTPSVRASNGLAVLGSGNKRHIMTSLPVSPNTTKSFTRSRKGRRSKTPWSPVPASLWGRHQHLSLCATHETLPVSRQ
jgi:hypothetical protein